MSNLEGKFYPALHLGDFADGHEAMLSVGIAGQLADLCVAGIADNPGNPAVYEAEFIDGAASTKINLVLVPMPAGKIRLCLGYFDLLADSEHEALMHAGNAIAEGAILGNDVETIPEFSAFRWTTPRRVLQ